MNAKIFGFLVILCVMSIIPLANAQISIDEKATQKSVKVIISSDGEVHVKHVVRSSNLPQDLELIYGTISNISVTNERDEEKLFSTNEDNSMVLIQPSNEELIIEYDLDEVLSQKDTVWTWDFTYLETTSFIFPEEVDLIFVNDNIVNLDNQKRILCHGCQMILEYSINAPKIFKNVELEDKEFVVEIKSHSNIDEFIFDQPTKSITFDIFEGNRFVTIIIPLELIWEPYSVFLNDEKIDFYEYINNGTHVWLNMRPEISGEIIIIGTTAIPEFPIIAPLAIGFLIILVMPLIRKVNLR